MTPDQLLRLETLRDRLVDVALVDADPSSWVGYPKKPIEMTREERGDAKWCRSLAVSTIALTMQVQRLMSNPSAGGALVPDKPNAAQQDADEEVSVDAEIERYERAARQVLAKARTGGNGKP